MAILTEQAPFTGTAATNDVIHIVDVSDTTSHPDGTSYKIPLSGLTSFFSTYLQYWTSGSTGNFSIKVINDSGLDALGDYSYAEGQSTTAGGIASHAEGSGSQAIGQYSHAEGDYSTASGDSSHAEGYSIAIGAYSHSEGISTTTIGGYSHSEGSGTTAFGLYSHAEGSNSIASGSSSHAEGSSTVASGLYSHAEGRQTTASGAQSHAEGSSTTASSQSSHAEGFNNIAANFASHAEGQQTLSNGANAHAEGLGTTATGGNSHSEGSYTESLGIESHAGGKGLNGKHLIVDGETSFGHFKIVSSTKNTGIYSDQCVILGGMDNYIPTGLTRTVILGGNSITGLTSNTVYAPNINIQSIAAYDNEAAATIGGLETGTIYQTTGAGASPLNVAGILLIKQ